VPLDESEVDQILPAPAMPKRARDGINRGLFRQRVTREPDVLLKGGGRRSAYSAAWRWAQP
jgi:hypothetical protein